MTLSEPGGRLTILLMVRKAFLEDGESTLTSKGQTTIPKSIRNALALKPGDRLTFTLLPDRSVLLRVQNRSVLSLSGMLRPTKRRRVGVRKLSR